MLHRHSVVFQSRDGLFYLGLLISLAAGTVAAANDAVLSTSGILVLHRHSIVFQSGDGLFYLGLLISLAAGTVAAANDAVFGASSILVLHRHSIVSQSCNNIGFNIATNGAGAALLAGFGAAGILGLRPLAKAVLSFTLNQDHGRNAGHADGTSNGLDDLGASLGSIDADLPLTSRQRDTLGRAGCIEDDHDRIGDVIGSLGVNGEHDHFVADPFIGDILLDLRIGLHAQSFMGLTERDQALVVLSISGISPVLQVGPLDVVDIVGGVVAVLAAATIFFQLLTEHFLTGVDEGDTLGGHVDSSCQVVHLDNVAVDGILASGQDQLVDEGIVVMAGSVLDDLAGIAGPPGHCHEVVTNSLFLSGLAGHEAQAGAVGTSQQIADGVGEVCEFGSGYGI